MQISITMNLTEIRSLLDQAPAITMREIQSTLRIICARVEKEVVEKTPKGVGADSGLMGSIHGEVVKYGESFMGSVGTPVEYGEVVEMGRRPGKRPYPLDPLVRWAEKKLGLKLEEAEKAAEAIAWKIKWHGTEGAHMFKKTFDELDFWITQELCGIPDRVVAKINRSSSR